MIGRYALLVAVLGVPAAACSSSPTEMEWPPLPAGAVAVSFQVIDEAHTTHISGIADRRRLVIRTQDAWESFWAELTAPFQPAPPVPTVDFTRQMVVAATMGQRSTGGFAIEISEIARADGTLFVRVLETSPGEDCVTTQAVTAPATAVTVDLGDEPVEFQEAAATANCS